MEHLDAEHLGFDVAVAVGHLERRLPRDRTAPPLGQRLQVGRRPHALHLVAHLAHLDHVLFGRRHRPDRDLVPATAVSACA